MPELPEVQAHAERLETAFAGVTLSRFEPLSFSVLKTVHPDPASLVGQSLERVHRRGKYLILEFAEGSFVVHLMQGGRLRPDTAKSKRPRGGLARWRFEDGRGLLLTEAGTERKAGVWVVAQDPLNTAPLESLGPEATEVDAQTLAGLFEQHPMRLHTLLREQAIMAGVGRRLANEICHRARLSPFVLTRSVDQDAAAGIVSAIRDAVADDLEAERARDGMSTSKERPSRVHNRAGQPCPVCGDEVRAVEYRDYTVNYCPTCQTGGKVLSDNVLSRLGAPREEWGTRPKRR